MLVQALRFIFTDCCIRFVSHKDLRRYTGPIDNMMVERLQMLGSARRRFLAEDPHYKSRAQDIKKTHPAVQCRLE